MLLQNLKVDCKSLLDYGVVLLGHFAKVDADCISFLQLRQKLLLNFSVLLELALLAQFGQLVMQLL